MTFNVIKTYNREKMTQPESTEPMPIRAETHDLVHEAMHDTVQSGLEIGPPPEDDWRADLAGRPISDLATDLQVSNFTHQVSRRMGELVASAEQTVRQNEALEAENKALNAKHDDLEREATTDPLTGALNKKACRNLIESLIARDKPFGIYFIDLNKFKSVNDQRGHGVGDELLRQLVRGYLGSLRPNETLTRVGGDEFVIVVEEAITESQDRRGPSEDAGITERRAGVDRRKLLDKEKEAAGLLERMYQATALAAELVDSQLAETGQGSVSALGFGASIGYASYQPGDTFDTLYHRADADMYEIKRGFGVER